MDFQFNTTGLQGLHQDKFRLFFFAGIDKLQPLRFEISFSQRYEQIDRPGGRVDEITPSLWRQKVGSHRYQVVEGPMNLVAGDRFFSGGIQAPRKEFSIRRIGEDDLERTWGEMMA